jgi:phosphoribosylaminoimidazolecarboxamide formyltransferase / IMP cyclohydrolase
MATALLMAAKKDQELVKFARGLHSLGWTLLGSRGTALFLNQENVPTTDMATLAGEPILGHRVVSLSREIHAGLLSKPDDQPELDRLRITKIDLLFVDFYDTRMAIAKHPDIIAGYDAINEDIDIGGPTAVRSAIKGGRIVLADPIDFTRTLQWLSQGRPDERQVLATMWANAETIVCIYVDSVAEFRRAYQRLL